MIMLNSRHDQALAIRQGFVQMLPKLRGRLRWFFRGRMPEQCSELISEAIALAFEMYQSARAAGQDFQVTPLARFAALKVTAGRRFRGTYRQDVFCSPDLGLLDGEELIRLGLCDEIPDSLRPDRKARGSILDQVAFRLD